MALRHVVMWTLKNPPSDAPTFVAELESCRGIVPGMLAFHVASKREGLEANVDVMLDATFEDRAALDAYQRHPQHQAASARIGPLRQTRHVLDYEEPE
jgi:quinol monooxygenase YgiN